MATKGIGQHVDYVKFNDHIVEVPASTKRAYWCSVCWNGTCEVITQYNDTLNQQDQETENQT